jgi:septation ring formation regulator EzrA
MSENMFKPEESRVIARYQRMLSESADREARYGALADTLANQVAMLQEELRRFKDNPAAGADGTAESSTS